MSAAGVASAVAPSNNDAMSFHASSVPRAHASLIAYGSRIARVSYSSARSPTSMLLTYMPRRGMTVTN